MVIIYTQHMYNEKSRFYDDAVEVGVLDEKSSGEGFGCGGAVGTSPFVASATAASVEDCSPVREVPSASSSSLISAVAR